MTTIDYEDQTMPSNEIVQVARIVNRPAVPSVPPPPVERPLAAPVGVRKVSIPPKTEPVPVVRAARPDTSPPTIIPIPKLPSIKNRTSQIQPVVAPVRPSRTRLAKGTGPVSGTHVGVAPPPPIRSGEETSPGVAMPVAARAVSLPSLKSRASR